MTARHDLHRRWAKSAPPLRPPLEAIASMARAIEGRSPALLLGVTPELAELTACTAIDWSAEMIAGVWPGGLVVRADWLAMPFADGAFGLVIGDGSFNMLAMADHAVAFAQLRRVLRPGGRIAVRCFTAPEAVPEDVRRIALAGGYGGFHELKWRVATLAVREAGLVDIEGRAILARFDTLFPDRVALSSATGWPLSTMAEIDDYRDASWTMSFPTRAQFETAFPGAAWVESGDYAMAELCPILVVDL